METSRRRFPVDCNFAVAHLSPKIGTRVAIDQSRRVVAKIIAIRARESALGIRARAAPAEAIVKDQANAQRPQSRAEMAIAASRQWSRWKGLWPIYCVAIGIVLILVGALV
jgi:hypothetical protein